VGTNPPAAYPALTEDAPGANKKLKLFAHFCSKEDSLLINADEVLSAALPGNGVTLQYNETEVCLSKTSSGGP